MMRGRTARPTGEPIMASVRSLFLLAGGLLISATVVETASAQVYVRPFGYGGIWRGDVVLPPVPRAPVGMHPSDIILDLEERGYHSMTISGRRNDVYIIDGMTRRNEPVRLVVDRFDGEILERFSRQSDAARRPPMPDIVEPKREGERGSKKSGSVAEIPAPPRRPAEPEAAPASPPGTDLPARRPQPVAPARDPSLWAPKS